MRSFESELSPKTEIARVQNIDRQSFFSEITRRKNLFREFRKFKRRKQRLWNIVVTERAKKEMADQEAEMGKR